MAAIQRLPGAFLGVVFLASCAEPAGPPAREAPPAPSFNFSNNPDNGNPRIFRFQEFAF